MFCKWFLPSNPFFFFKLLFASLPYNIHCRVKLYCFTICVCILLSTTTTNTKTKQKYRENYCYFFSFLILLMTYYNFNSYLKVKIKPVAVSCQRLVYGLIFSILREETRETLNSNGVSSLIESANKIVIKLGKLTSP